MNRNFYKPSFTKNRKKYAYNRRRTSKKSAQDSRPKPGTDTCPIKMYNFKVKLFPSRCRLRKTGRTMAKISKYHILESKNTGQNICHKILDTDIGLGEHYRNINLDSVIPALSPILQIFKIRHNRFNYFEKLKCITENIQRNTTQRYKRDRKKQRDTKKYKHQIDIRLLQSFFSLLLYKNVPFELFGTLKNRKLIKKTICRLLKTVPGKVSVESAFRRTVKTGTVTGALLDMRPLFQKLDISNISWLHSINNNISQWIVMLKLLHWFFAQYIIKILHKYVVLKVVQGQWVYITKDNWCNMQEEFIKEKENTLSLVPFTNLNKRYHAICPLGTYRFIPSSSGLRALFITKYNIKEKYDDIDVVLRFLQLLYITYFNKNGIPTIASCRKEFLDFINKYEKSEKQLYFVICDIQDAFGSIIQQKLYDIINMYCDPEKYFLVRNVKIKKRQKRKFTVRIKSLHEETQLSKNAILSKEKPKHVKTKFLLNKIYKLIFHQRVKLNDQIYSIKIGVPQGASVSPILSDIYYQHMFKEVFTEYKENSLLCRYVDDIMYITENEHYAAKFLQTIRNGISQYNTKFNPNKIISGIVPYKSTEIKFLKQIPVTR